MSPITSSDELLKTLNVKVRGRKRQLGWIEGAVRKTTGRSTSPVLWSNNGLGSRFRKVPQQRQSQNMGSLFGCCIRMVKIYLSKLSQALVMVTINFVHEKIRLVFSNYNESQTTIRIKYSRENDCLCIREEHILTTNNEFTRKPTISKYRSRTYARILLSYCCYGDIYNFLDILHANCSHINLKICSSS